MDATPPTFNATQRAYYDAIIDRIRGWRKLVAFNRERLGGRRVTSWLPGTEIECLLGMWPCEV